ncbi:MAG: succinate--CoA ligase subunit beta, partial [Nitrospinae bacterium]|nr:succinate--CoA ligase subunit beta [Nitrospinota bacterium]
VPIPKYIMVKESGETVTKFVDEQLGGAGAVVKAMVLVGKRGKAGAVKLSGNAAETNTLVDKIATMEVYGEKSIGALVCEKLSIEKEIYISFTYNTQDRKPALTISMEGGMDVEEIDPANIHVISLEAKPTLYPYEVRNILQGINFPYTNMLRQFSEVISNIYSAFWESESRLMEINPLVICGDPRKEGAKRIVAADAVVILDDDASIPPTKLYPERSAMGRPPTQRELDATKIDEGDHRGKAGSYVELDGDIALMTFGGGGSTVTSQTCLELGMRIANLTDIGGNPPAEKMNRISKIILDKPGLVAILVCGGTASNTRIDVTLGEGLVSALEELDAEGKLNKNLIWLVRRNGPESEKGLKMLGECFQRLGIKGEIYDSSLPLTAAPKRLLEIIEKEINYKGGLN